MQDRINDPKRSLEEDLKSTLEYLMWYWRSRGRPEMDVQDAAQLGAIQAFLKADRWKRGSKRSTFFVTVGIRAGQAYFRKEDRRRRLLRKVFGVEDPDAE